ncbi:MAG: glycoside hydrolase family 127 protein, partial [Anaerolineales bacterium]
GRRFTNLRDEHELYCAGHLVEAAVAHHQATGKRSLLDALRRYADYIGAVFGREAGKLRGYCGHEEIELALVKLHQATGEPRYLKLAQYFVDERGQQPHYFDFEAEARGADPRAYHFGGYDYMQAHRPVREQTVVTGHAVRAMYLYSAMADLAAARATRETGDESLWAACEQLWRSVCEERMYLTGGIGPSASNEGFTFAYDLPDETAYAETCAAVGMVFWNHRLLQLTGDGKYADVMERALYNGSISGVSLDGRTFFYENPLASRGDHHRQDWFDCACCPPNIARLIASAGGYFYSTHEDGLWVHLYASGEARVTVKDAEITVRQTTNYPWDGAVEIALHPDQPQTFTLNLRIPGWCEAFTVSVNGTPVTSPATQQGYLRLARREAWRAGDVVTLNLAMPAQFVRANPAARHMLGRVALQRGPIVYCLEEADNLITPLDRIVLTTSDSAMQPEHRPDLLGGVTVLRGDALALDNRDWEGRLYRAQADSYRPVEITAVPYCVWDNREPGEMRVWLRGARSA